MNESNHSVADPLAGDRYSRQILFRPLGPAGQKKLSESSVAIVGCGALGSFQAEALARAGAGSLLLIDRDYVDPTNLHRQSLYDERDAERLVPKALAARERLMRLNSQVSIRSVVADLNAANVVGELAGADLILDGTDNFETRYLLNDVSLFIGVPWIYGAAIGSYGITTTFVPGEGPCLRCIFPEPPAGAQPTCDTAGILGPAVSAVASIQVMEAIKLLSGNRGALHRKLISFDLWENRFQAVGPGGVANDCPACQGREFRFLQDTGSSAIRLCGRNAVQIHETRGAIDLEAFARMLEPLGNVRWNEYVLRFGADGCDLTVFPDGRAIIKGTEDIAEAKKIYDKYLPG